MLNELKFFTEGDKKTIKLFTDKTKKKRKQKFVKAI